MATRISWWHKGLSLASALTLTLGLSAIPFTPAGAQASEKMPVKWVAPRTADGRPDLQGNWSNETQTPLERLAIRDSR